MNLDAGLFIVRALSCWVFNREVFHSLISLTGEKKLHNMKLYEAPM